ncbi:MAG: T9SS type A sorting domain-containing protein [Candidatus Krumholzibacteriota bacterium]|nr:T9SS type A sorting domain-containing protein [Candidatus Krumholzibacteriota bacterium]
MRATRISGLCCLIFLLPGAAFSENLRATTVPDVDFAIVRLDYRTRAIKGYYEFSHPWRKSLPEEGYAEAGNVFYRYVAPCDLGYVRIQSRLTGELLVEASTVWMGMGTFCSPPVSLFSADYLDGYTNPPPDTLIYLPIGMAGAEYADSAWSEVQGTDIIHRLAALGSYEVVLYDHFYTVGASDPSTAEWIVIAYTRPPAPDDMALVALNWPKTLVTRNVDFIPEIVVHNFSDRTLSARVDLTMTTAHGPSGERHEMVDLLPPDSSLTVLFDPIVVLEPGDADLDFDLVNPDGSPLVDAYAGNNGWRQDIEVIDLPVFRPVSSLRHPGSVPMYGKALDFDDDGDVDIVQLSHPACRLWRNDGAGAFVDVTGQSAVSFPGYAEEAIAADFNGDGHSDLIVVVFNSEPGYYLGDGTGVFVDATGYSGLSGTIGYADVDAFDKENDGDQDLVFQSYGQELVFENDGGGHFTDVTATSGLVDPVQTERVTVGDIDGDGFPDLALANWGSPSRVFVNDGSGRFSEIAGPWDFDYARKALIFDFDGDGLGDVLFARALHADLSILYRNLGGLSFEETSAGWGGLPSAFSAAAADCDGDGSQDLLLEDLDEWKLLMYEDGIYVDRTELLVDCGGELIGTVVLDPRFVDLDGDGDLDVYSQGVYFENQGLCGSHSGGDRPPVPESCLLRQNYPNPFNPATTIRFDLPRATHVRLRVYNVKGELVATLVNRRMTAGWKEVSWNATDDMGGAVSSGIYFCRLLAGGFAQTKKMVVLR